MPSQTLECRRLTEGGLDIAATQQDIHGPILASQEGKCQVFPVILTPRFGTRLATPGVTEGRKAQR